MKAIWNNEIIAQSDNTINIEGNQYFPPDTVNMDFLKPSDTHTFCPWKGTASFYSVVVNGKENVDAAWYYPQAKDAAKGIEGYVAFWRGVNVVED